MSTVIPVKGEVWQHTKTGGCYVIGGASLNTITDKVDVLYEPLYQSSYRTFSRQIVGHPKAFLSINEDGKPRFQRVARSAQEYAERLMREGKL